MTHGTARLEPREPWLDAPARERLEGVDPRRAPAGPRDGWLGAPSASRRASPGTLDPSALIAASRRPGEHWFCLEQPDREGLALGALGCTRLLEASGHDRFGLTARRCTHFGAGKLRPVAAGTGSFSAPTRAQIETIRNMTLRIHEIMQRFSSLEKEMNVVAQQAEQDSGKSYAATAGGD